MRSFLVRCYPAHWRARYGDEFEALLEQTSLGPLDVADILLGALDAQLRLRGHEAGIAHGEGFLMPLRIGGIAAILGAALWAAAGVVNSGILADADARLPGVLLAAALPLWLVAMAGLSAFQARTNPTLSWVAFLVPAVGIVACVVGMAGISMGGGEGFWPMFGLGALTAILGSTLFAFATYRTAALSRGAAALLGVGSVVTLLTISNAGLQLVAAAGLASFALGWFALGVDAIRLARRNGMTWMIESVRDAVVAPEDVFRLYLDPSTWSVWGHNAKWARAHGPLVEGGIVDVKAGYGKVYPCRIRRLVGGRFLELEVRPPLMTVIQTYEVEPTAEGAHIRHALEISGPLAGITRLVRLDRIYQGWLDKEVGRLIEMAGSSSRRTDVLRADPRTS